MKRALPLLALALAGCGSESVRELPPAAGPGRAPALTTRPAGRLVRLPAPPESLAADPRTGIVAVGLRRPDEVGLVDGRTGRLLRRVPVPESAPHDATAAGGRVFVGDEHGNTVTVLQDGRTIRTLKVATRPGGITPVDGGRQIAVVSVRERVVETYDTRTLERTGRAPAGVGPTHVVGDGKDLLYVTDTAGDGLVVMHLRPKLEVTRRVAFPGGAPYGIAIDDVRHRLWVTLTKRNEVAEVRANARPGVIRRFPTARQANTVAVDSATGRVFVTGLDRQVLQLFDPPDAKRLTR